MTEIYTSDVPSGIELSRGRWGHLYRVYKTKAEADRAVRHIKSDPQERYLARKRRFKLRDYGVVWAVYSNY